MTGRLEINGELLGRRGARLRVLIPEGYGDTGFQSTGLVFPMAGCWRVTGSAGGTSLTFMTLVVGERKD